MGAMLTACTIGSNADGTFTDATPVVASPAATLAESPDTTTSQPNDGIIELDSMRRALGTNTLHVADGFLVPLSVIPGESGWTGAWIRTDIVDFEWNPLFPRRSWQDRDSLSVTVLAYSPELPVNEVIALILAIDGIEPLSIPVATSVAGHAGLTFDVFGEEPPEIAAGSSCTQHRVNNDGGYLLVSYEYAAFGIPACGWARLWVVDVSGTTITFVGATMGPDGLTELMARAESLIASLKFQDGLSR